MKPVLSLKAIALIILFTIVESLVLGYWLVLLGVPLSIAFYGPALVFLLFGLFLEHLLAGISNKV